MRTLAGANHQQVRHTCTNAANLNASFGHSARFSLGAKELDVNRSNGPQRLKRGLNICGGCISRYARGRMPAEGQRERGVLRAQMSQVSEVHVGNRRIAAMLVLQQQPTYPSVSR